MVAHRARDQDTSVTLSGRLHISVGYLIAALWTVVFGGLHTLTGDWVAPLALLLAVIAALSIVGVFAGRDVLEGARG